MTKIYEGAGVYTVHLSSGKTLELTESELEEFVTEEREEIKQHLKEEFNYLLEMCIDERE